MHTRVGIEHARAQEGRYALLSRGLEICMPRLQRDPSTSSLHDFVMLVRAGTSRRDRLTHGAMITLAPGIGN
jgi:hypothetical protein